MGGSERAVIWGYQKQLRKTEYYFNNGKRILLILNKIKLSKLQNKTSLHIPINTCDIGLHIMHLGPILINGKSHIGKNCSIHINTVIAASGTSDKAPTIGDDVVIGVGAIIIGDIIINNGIAIGANALVNKSFNEENIAIAGVPASKISNNGKSKWK